MKESEFIDQNKEKWLDFEKNIVKKNSDPSKTSKLFIQITDDLSYARTFYPNRSVKLYLNGIAKVLFNDLNKSKKRGMASFLNFWKKDLPLTVYASRRAILISFLIFVGCFILGVITSVQDKDFARSILSNDYVNMTNENIEKGDPMAVYKSHGEMETFLPIFYNNLQVDFLTFFSGIFLAIGSLVIMIVNGVMVGVFQYFFIERGLFWESFLAIWTHGALEISAIIISGGAGLTLGKGLLFPGTHSRFSAFKLSGLQGLKIILSVIPITLFAAFIEGFLTRHTSIPDPIRFVFILISFSFILGYFFYYPRIVAKQSENEKENGEGMIVYKPTVEFDPSEIQTGTKIITETFAFLFRNFSLFFKLILIVSAVFTLIISWNPFFVFYEYDVYSFRLNDFFNYSQFPMLGILLIVSMMIVTPLSLTIIKRKLESASARDRAINWQNIIRVMFTSCLYTFLFTFIIYTNIDLTFALSQLLFPLFIFFLCVSNFQNNTAYQSISYSASLLAKSWHKFLIISAVFATLSIIFYATTNYVFKFIHIKDAVIWMLTNDDVTSLKISLALEIFLTLFSFLFYLMLSLISNSVLFYTLKEIFTAEHLLTKINAIKIKK